MPIGVSEDDDGNWDEVNAECMDGATCTLVVSGNCNLTWVSHMDLSDSLSFSSY